MLVLPSHFSAEQSQLSLAGLKDWPALAAQSDPAASPSIPGPPPVGPRWIQR